MVDDRSELQAALTRVIGSTETWEVVTEERHSTRSYGKPEIDVLASPALIGLIEEATIRILDPVLPAKMTSVGTHVDFRHLRSSEIGAAIRIVSAAVETEKRFVTFRVEAYDGDVLIASCQHTRAAVKLVD